MLRVKFHQSLPFRLATSILLLSAAVLVTLTEISRRAVERHLLQQAEVQAMLSTAAVVDGLDAVVGTAERIALLVARELEDGNLSPARAEKRARDVLLDFPSLYSCALVLSGESTPPSAPTAVAVEVYRAPTPERFATRQIAASNDIPWPPPWYQEVVEKSHVVWGEPYLDAASGRSAVRVAAPIFRDADEEREPIGAVAIVLDLTGLRRLANLQEFSDTSFTIVFSRSGRVVLHPKPTYAVAETIESLAEKTGAGELLTIRQNILSKRQGFLRYQESNPPRRVHVNYKPAKFAGWGVIVGFDEAEFLKTQRAYRVITFTLLGALLLLLVVIIVLLTHFALKPLARLAVAAEEIGRGNLDCAIPVPSRQDEVGRLGRTFSAMRDSLKAQFLERRWAAQSLEHQLHYHRLIVDSMQDPVFVLTKSLRISRINPAALQGTGRRETELLQSTISRVLSLAGQPETTKDVLTCALKEERELRSVRVALHRADGVDAPYLLNLVPIQDAGRVVGAVVTLHRDSATSQ